MNKAQKKIKYQSPKIVRNKKVKTDLLSKKGYSLDNLLARKAA